MAADNKLSVFLGSPKGGLEEIRTKLITAIAEAGHIPSGMELWAASHKPVPEAIRTHLGQCDVHVVLLGARYGSMIDGREISYTEYEYLESKRANRPVIAFLVEQKLLEAMLKAEEVDLKRRAQIARKQLNGRKKRATKADLSAMEQAFQTAVHELRLAASYREKLWRLRRELESHAIVRYFDPDHPARVAADLTNSLFEARRDLGEHAGWLRATTPEAQLSILEKNELLRSIVDQIRRFSTLTQRLEENSTVKRAMGKAFWDTMLGRIRRKEFFNVFFESGSTLAYVADQFHEVLRAIKLESEPVWHIYTNNVVVLLQLQLKTALSVTALPSGVPENKYGAILDDNLMRPHDAAPTKARRLFEDERAAIERMQAQLRRQTPCLYLISASGLDLSNKEEHLRGPHVGGQPHMLIKHSIARTGQPSVLFLDEDKLKKAFHPGRCFPVFTPDYPLQTVCAETPLAVCLGFRAGSGRALERQRVKLTSELTVVFPGFDWSYGYRRYENIGVMLGANSRFAEIFGND